MASWNAPVITQKGIALLAKLATGDTLAFVRAVAGTGYVDPAVLGTQSDISGEQVEMTFSVESHPEEGKSIIPVRLTNTGVVTEFMVQQYGVIAFDPDEGDILFMIAQADEGKGTIVPTAVSKPGFSAEWRILLEYEQADGVTVTVDPSNTASIADVQTMLDEQLGNVDNTSDAEKYVAYASSSGTANKTKNALTIRFKGGKTEGDDMFTFDGSTGKSVNITPEKIQALPGLQDTFYDETCYYRTVNGEKEWINPPMMYGEEFRTTERWNLIPVYTKLVRITGVAPGSTESIEYGVNGEAFPIRCEARTYGTENKTFPIFEANSLTPTAVVYACDNRVYCSSSDTNTKNISCEIQVWYMKYLL